MPVSNPVKIESGQSYQSEITIDSPYHVSEWTAYPGPSYDIPISGQLRITVRYFLGETAWNGYVSARDKAQKSIVGVNDAFAERLAVSDPIAVREDH